MARVKPQIQIMTISSIDEADKALQELCELSREIELINLEGNEKIDSVKAEMQAKALPLTQRTEVIGAALNAYALGNKKELFAKEKSKALNFGTIGFRASTKIKTMSKIKWEDVFARIKENSLLDFIRTKEEVDKEKLKKADSSTLEIVGCQVVTEDTFFYELDKEKVVQGA